MSEATAALRKAEVAAALRGGPFAASLERDAPLAVLVGEPLRLGYASPAALELFDVDTLLALEAMLVGAQSPGARRLRQLAAADVSTPRLEQLRFFARGAPRAVGLLTGRVVGPEGAAWLVAASPDPAPVIERPPFEPAFVEATPAPLGFQASPLDGPVRFLWSSDAEGRIVSAGPELGDRLGPNAPRLGERIADLCARAGLGSRWPEAVDGQRTFSSLRLEWPEPVGGRARVVKLSGAPATEGAKFVGYRGFGLFTGEGVEAPEPVVPAPSPVVRPPEPAERPGAEIVMLRPVPPPSANIVPIRPGPLNGLTSAQDAASLANPHASVELTSQERDAFREIARALGARRRNDAPEGASPEVPVEVGSAPAVGEADLCALIDALPIGALVARGPEALFANRPWLEFTGYESLEAFQAADGLKTMFRGRAPTTLLAGGEDAPVLAAGGELVIVHAQASPVAWAGGPATLISLRRSRDVEHNERALALETEARAAAQRGRDHLIALDLAADGLVRLDANGRILMMSPRAEALFGYRPQEAAGSNFLTLLSPQSQGPALAAFLQAVGPDSGFVGKPQAEGQARSATGRVFACRLTFGRFPGADPVEAFFVAEDREGASAEERERDAARKDAVRANERKTEFLALVSHEIRTPLQAILGFAEVMIEERFGPIVNERYKEYLRDIHASGKHVISLANDLIDLAKIEAGKLELVFEPVDANQIIRDCVALMQPQAARERIIMRMSLSDKLPNVMADVRSLRQIMLNLMSNAVKFNEPGGQVIVSTALDDAGAAVIRVRDTGVGMSEPELALALEPFRRADSGKTADGAGLGLPLTKALVEANHADFSIKSRKEQGTLVEVAFSTIRAAQ